MNYQKQLKNFLYQGLSGQFKKMNNIEEIDELIKLISKLPGLGPKSAKRIILKLLNNKEKIYKPLVNSLANVFKNIITCDECGTLMSNQNSCENCKLTNKKINKICVVETIADQWSVETSHIFNGYFHVLGGTLTNNIQDVKNNLLIDALVNRVKKNNIEEVIIATSSTIEGQTTAFYLKDCLKDLDVKITKLAQGIPVGGEIEALDDGTLVSAFKNRTEIKNL